MDTWASIQENKRKQENLRERIKRRRKEGQNLLAHTVKEDVRNPIQTENITPKKKSIENTKFNDEIETRLQQYLCTQQFNFPVKIQDLTQQINKNENLKKEISQNLIEILLEKQAVQLLVTLKREDNQFLVTSIDQSKLTAIIGNTELKKQTENNKSKKVIKPELKNERNKHGKSQKLKDSNNHDDIEELLSIKSAKESDSKKISDEIQDLLSTSTTKELILAKNFRSMGGSQVKEFCTHGTREECTRRGTNNACKKVHFKKILKPHTDEALGDCSFLNTCFHMDTCKYVHYEIDYRGTDHARVHKRKLIQSKSDLLDDQHYITRKMIPPQWINCDVRYIDMSILGKFSVIMADPPWDIHMELPYGTMQDDEMRALRIQDLSNDGLMFLWVTGRAMELGRELFDIWGYKRCDELIWVKTNQLQRLIRTGRTGHWLNHGKEHCLVGIKGDPKGINRGLDCDVLVAEVRDTSHKPDEIYGIIERLSPGTRKLEIFGRMHNVQPNW